jgi:hypothetical protein
MKNQILTALVTTALGVSAFAGSLSMDSRADLESSTPNDAAKVAGGTSYNRFKLNTLRLDGKGNFNENTSFRLRFRFNNGALATSQARDSVNSAIDFAYVQHKVMDNLSFQIGKFGTDIGGVEGMTAGPDLYFTSQGYGEQSALRYATGLKAMYNIMEGNEINLMVMNEEVDASNGTAFNQTRNAAGIVYKGSFMDKMLMPVLSYHEDNLQPTGATGTAAFTDRKYTFASAGLKWEMSPMFVELDYLYNTFKNKSVMDETDKTSSAVGTLGYKMENMVAKLKFESSEAETFSAAATSSKLKYAGYQLALEYMPTGDKNFRYHAAYVSRDTKPETGDTQTTQTAVVGVRLIADFLK